MPSSRTRSLGSAPTRWEALQQLLSGVPDPRDPRGVRHPLVGVLAVAIAAVVAGSRSFVAIGEWAAEAGIEVLAGLGITGRGPDEATFRRVFARLDADALDRVLGAWMFARTRVVQGHRMIAIDGKSVRGAKDRHGRMPHLVAAFDHHAAAVLGQLAVTDKSNEIPCVRDLLACFDLTGVVVTVDAMHTQTGTAELITGAGGDYVFTIKGNTPTLHRQLKALPWKDVPARSVTDTGHGRRVTRTIKVAAPAWVTFPGAAQVAQVRRTVTKAGKRTVEIVYLITSADPVAAPPAVLAAWVQGHWSIEKGLHWVRDVTFDEDRSQIRTGQAPRVMATLRNTAISLLRMAGWDNIAQALRHHARHPERLLKLLLTS